MSENDKCVCGGSFVKTQWVFNKVISYCDRCGNRDIEEVKAE